MRWVNDMIGAIYTAVEVGASTGQRDVQTQSFQLLAPWERQERRNVKSTHGTPK